MNLYISDLHFGHTNVIRFDHRPFADVEEMDRCMIQLWNSRVSDSDDVFIVGDFCYRSQYMPDWYLRQLKGHKHLIIGNHDQVTLQCESAARYLESVEKMCFVVDGDKAICLCHFPIAEWNKYRSGSWHIYGHIHASITEEYQFMRSRERALNAAACINNYTPVSMNELIRNNEAFQNSNPVDKMMYVVKNRITGEEFTISGDDLMGDYELRPAGSVHRNLPTKKVSILLQQ